mgnify:CR=1 FL=1
MSKKETKIWKVINNCAIAAWDYYRLEIKRKAKNTYTTLFWLGGDGAVPRSGDGTFEGRVKDTGNGLNIELESQDVALNYSEARTMLILLQAVDPDICKIDRYKLEVDE